MSQLLCPVFSWFGTFLYSTCSYFSSVLPELHVSNYIIDYWLLSSSCTESIFVLLFMVEECFVNTEFINCTYVTLEFYIVVQQIFVDLFFNFGESHVANNTGIQTS